MANQTEGFDTKAVDTQELSEKELKFGYWFVTHKKGLAKFGKMALILFSVITFGYSIIATGYYFIFQYTDYQNALFTLPDDYVNVLGQHQANRILPLEVISREVLSAGTGKIDIAVRVRNPNTKWGLRGVTYQFTVGGQFYDKERAFVLPGEEKYLLTLNVSGIATGTPQVFFEDEDWWRVTKYEDWGPERTNFLITDKKFTSARQTELSEQLPISQVTAMITNASAFNYDEVEIQVALLSGNRLVGVNTVPFQDFASSETRPMVARWTENLPPISTVEIFPTVNILEEEVYADYEGVFDPAILEVDLD